MAKRIGWPFATFVIAGALSGLFGLMFLGYQDLFAVYETSVQTEQGVIEQLEVGEGIRVSFNLPVHTASVVSALHPHLGATVEWDDEVTPEYAKTLIVTPTESVRAGESVVLSLEGIRSLFGTTLPERLYAFPTRPTPSVERVVCDTGVDVCRVGDDLIVTWSGSFEYATATYELESGRDVVAQQTGQEVRLFVEQDEVAYEQDALIIRLFEGQDGGKLVGRTPLWEERIPIVYIVEAREQEVEESQD